MTAEVTSLPDVFVDEAAFNTAFVDGLESMLDSGELGAFILVMANANFDPAIQERLAQRLEDRFGHWQMEFHVNSAAAQQAAPDDQAVFRQIMTLGYEQIAMPQRRTEGPWQLQYNMLRGLRPARNAQKVSTSVSEPFNPDGFHFNKPFLAPEVFWEDELLGRPVRLLYNKFPFASLHGLFVIEPLAQKPQWLTQEDHLLVWQLLDSLGDDMPMGIGYNAMGAFASVNHQHFQSFVSRKKFPVELGCWTHNGGNLSYPLPCQRFIDAEQAWQFLDTQQQANRPFNLLYRSGELYATSRAFQGSYAQDTWTYGFAWSEISGSIAVATEADFHNLQATDIETQMQRMR